MSSCSPETYFNDLLLVVNTNLAGVWPQGVWGTSTLHAFDFCSADTNAHIFQTMWAARRLPVRRRLGSTRRLGTSPVTALHLALRRSGCVLLHNFSTHSARPQISRSSMVFTFTTKCPVEAQAIVPHTATKSGRTMAPRTIVRPVPTL